ncbi:MAG: M23 family metallopeptidase [Gammaproteobacteria bacterium]
MLLLAVAFALQLVLPLGLVFWLWRRRALSRLEWLLRVLVVGSYLGAIALVGLWTFLPRSLPYLYIALFALAAVASWLRTPPTVPLLPQGLGWLGRIGQAAFAALFLSYVIGALHGRTPPPGAVDLAFPLKNGTYYVINGGSVLLVNFHARSRRPEMTRFRGQGYAVDLVKLNASGVPSNGLLAGDPHSYAIFAQPVYAPCAGIVRETENGVPDMRPPRTDPSRLLGDYVGIECKGVMVLLSHLERGSVQVAEGSQVARGQMVARVGNSGYSSEPHLQIHAQRLGAGRGATLLDADPVPVTFHGRYLVRGDQLTVGAGR